MNEGWGDKVRVKVCAFTYCCEEVLNISLHLHVDRFGHVHFAVLWVPLKY